VGALAQARLVLNKGDIMARQNQGINVKVPRVKVIKALEQSLVKLENNYKNQEAEDKKYLLAHDKWHKQVVKLATAKFNKGENVRVNVRYNGSINVDFDLPAGVVKLPKEPVRKYESIR
jgi:alpha-D-ribose 1-methylphosphonate 5-triphosphate synthase subunit PhnL